MGREGVVSGVRTFLGETASTYVLLCTFIQANVTGSSAYHFSLAERHAGSPCITNSVDDVHFDHTIGVGQVVNIKAKVNGAFTSSMKMQVIPRTQAEQMEYSIAAERRWRMRLIPAEIITDLLSSSTAQLGVQGPSASRADAGRERGAGAAAPCQPPGRHRRPARSWPGWRTWPPSQPIESYYICDLPVFLNSWRY
ncbi:acyl-coenzyme A thioesterase 11-like [Oncorhynchus mykiss]|uniref:acyl-coenzyme A thioesterase 11-like n=1 Tax=Oncorhynchus mykiss TaxID=8022 RepID=UPI001878EAE5|nr:acyl-coenzyme A thioesterase 11-like [Oncorhynchus mykiss]